MRRHHEPLIIRWPGQVQASLVIRTPVGSRTSSPLLEAAGVSGPGLKLDSMSLLPYSAVLPR
jgi:arylsulfatase A-like enzyme